jgi:hypothetical protein
MTHKQFDTVHASFELLFDRVTVLIKANNVLADRLKAIETLLGTHDAPSTTITTNNEKKSKKVVEEKENELAKII